MKCMQCGGSMTSARENYKYESLPGATLVSVEVHRCPKCGELEVAIPRIEELNRTLARTVIAKRTRLAPAEIRFLRKWLGFSGADFARHMGVRAETVSQWENGHEPVGPQSDRLLRLMVATREPLEAYQLDILTEINSDKAPPIRVGLKAARNGWSAEVGAA
ncbi:MAG: hypothetical protein NVSMB1_19850 [Polyangiales bacterium]